MSGLARPDDLLPSTATAWKIAETVAGTDFVPRAFRGKKGDVFAAIMVGRELGITPMQSLQSIHVVDGRPTLSAELMRALVLGHGHRIVVRVMSPECCTVWGQRHDTKDELEVSWTMEQARQAGVTSKSNWRNYPDAMLLARATSALCRALFPDVLAGVSYTAEELGSVEVEVVEAGGSAEWVAEREVVASALVPAEAVGTTTPAPTVEVPPSDLNDETLPDVDPDGQLADPEARIPRSVAQRLKKRMGELAPDLQASVRMVWAENKWPQNADGSLKLGALTQRQHLLVVSLLDKWDTTPPPDESPEQPWPDDPTDVEPAVETIEQGGLT